MADRSDTEAEAYGESEKNSHEMKDTFAQKVPEEMEMGSDIERAELLPAGTPAAPAQDEQKSSARAAIIWMVVNTLATIGIVRLHSPIAHFDQARGYSNSIHCRSSQTRPFSRILPSNWHNLHSRPSISSSHGSPSSHSPDLDLVCLYPAVSQSRRSYHLQSPCL